MLAVRMYWKNPRSTRLFPNKAGSLLSEDLNTICFAHKEYRTMQGVFSLQDVEEAHLPLIHHVESTEVVGMIPY